MTIGREACQDNSLSAEIRRMKKGPTKHPYARHKTQAGPARHVVLGAGIGLVYVGMRKYPPVEIRVFDINPAMDRIKQTKPPLWWRWDPDYQRIVKALSRYRSNRYSRDLMNALNDAWRC